MTIVHDPVVIVYLHRWYSEIPQFCIQLYITGNHVSNIALFRLLELKIAAHALRSWFPCIFRLTPTMQQRRSTRIPECPLLIDVRMGKIATWQYTNAKTQVPDDSRRRWCKSSVPLQIIIGHKKDRVCCTGIYQEYNLTCGVRRYIAKRLVIYLEILVVAYVSWKVKVLKVTRQALFLQSTTDVQNDAQLIWAMEGWSTYVVVIRMYTE